MSQKIHNKPAFYALSTGLFLMTVIGITSQLLKPKASSAVIEWRDNNIGGFSGDAGKQKPAATKPELNK